MTSKASQWSWTWTQSDLLAVAVDGDRLAGDRVEQGQGDQLLGELARTVVVGADAQRDRKLVGASVGPHQMVGGRLGGGVGGGRAIGLVFDGGRLQGGQSAVDLVGRDVMETHLLHREGAFADPEGARRLEQGEGPGDVCLDEGSRAEDG